MGLQGGSHEPRGATSTRGPSYTRGGDGQTQDHSTEPDESQLSVLQDRVNGRREVRVLTSTRRYNILYDPTLASPRTLHYSPREGGGDSLSLSDIREIQVRGSAAGTGAIVDQAFRGLLGLVGGIALASDPDWDAGPRKVAKATLPGALIGAAVGNWKTVYRAEPRRLAFAMVPGSPGRVAVAVSVRF